MAASAGPVRTYRVVRLRREHGDGYHAVLVVQTAGRGVMVYPLTFADCVYLCRELLELTRLSVPNASGVFLTGKGEDGEEEEEGKGGDGGRA